MADYIETGVVVGALVVAGAVATIAIRRVSRRVEDRIRPEEGPATPQGKRARTVAGVVRVSAIVAVWIVVALTALAQAGVAVGPLLAAAGLGGIVLGLGAQSLVRDLIAGFFVLAERQYDVGDVVELTGQGNTKVAGEVEVIALRTTTLRAIDGARHVVPNGEIRISSNLTREYSRYVVDLPVALDSDPDAAAQVMRRTAEQMRVEPHWREDILGPVTVLGVDSFDDSGLIVRGYLETHPGRQWEVGREFRRRVLAALEEAGVRMPVTQQEVLLREPPAAAP